MVDEFKTLAPWPLQDLDFGRGADGGPQERRVELS